MEISCFTKMVMWAYWIMKFRLCKRSVLSGALVTTMKYLQEIDRADTWLDIRTSMIQSAIFLLKSLMVLSKYFMHFYLIFLQYMLNNWFQIYWFYHPVRCLCGGWGKQEALSKGKSEDYGEKRLSALCSG